MNGVLGEMLYLIFLIHWELRWLFIGAFALWVAIETITK